MAMYDNANTVQKSFDLNFVSEHLIQAQWAEFIELKKVITELAIAKNAPISILDIGIGNARIPMHLCGVKEIWDMITTYDGTDNAQACVDISNQNIIKYNIQNKATAFLFEATALSTLQKKYDLVICTWFTPGNFYPDNFCFDTYKNAEEILDLTKNEKFDTVFYSAYNLLNEGGVLLLGACYIDNESTRQKQEESYNKMGMTVITSNEDTFTATKEGFWSQRFTKEKLYSYLHFADTNKIVITSLDTYNYAMQIKIKK